MGLKQYLKDKGRVQDIPKALVIYESLSMTFMYWAPCPTSSFLRQEFPSLLIALAETDVCPPLIQVRVVGFHLCSRTNQERDRRSSPAVDRGILVRAASITETGFARLVSIVVWIHDGSGWIGDRFQQLQQAAGRRLGWLGRSLNLVSLHTNSARSKAF